MDKIFDGKKAAKLGTEKKPVVLRVKTESRAKELSALCTKNGWRYIMELDPDKPEDSTDLELLLNPPEPQRAESKTGRNEPCPCGSGKKFKKCCGK